MLSRRHSRLWAALLLPCLSGCSLIFPFDVDQRGDGAPVDGQVDASIHDVGTSEAWIHDGEPGESAQTDGAMTDGSPSADATISADGSACPPCSFPSWCVQQPTNLSLNSVWGDALSGLWAVGAQGTVLRFNPGSCTWASVDAELQKGLGTNLYNKIKKLQLYGVWGVGNLVFVVGEGGTVLRWNGAGWIDEKLSVATTDHFFAVGGDAASSSIFAVGTSGKIYHRETGGVWGPWGSGVSQTLNGVTGLTATSPGPGKKALYVGGTGGALLYNDGSATKGFNTLAASGCSTSLNWDAVWASPTTPVKPAPELVAVASGGKILQYHSGSCTINDDLKGLQLRDVHGAEAADLWVVGAAGLVGRNVGGTWKQVTQGKTSQELRAVHVVPGASRTVVAVGVGGVVLRTTY